MRTWRTPFPYIITGAVLFMAFFIWAASQPQPPRWERKCVKGHSEEYMVMETSPGGGGAPGGAYPVIHSDYICDQHVRVCVTDPRWKDGPNVCVR